MIVISFPPVRSTPLSSQTLLLTTRVTLQLFGHELVGIICGDAWGVWQGFGIFAAGTVLGELGNYLCVILRHHGSLADM